MKQHRIRLDFNSINDIGNITTNDLIVVGGSKLWSLNTVNEQVDIINDSNVKCIDCLNEKILASQSNRIDLWDINKLINSYNVDNREVINDIKFLNNRCFITGGYNSSIKLFDSNIRQSIWEIKVCKDNINHIEVNEQIFVSTSDKMLVILDLKGDQLQQHEFQFIIINFKIYKDFMIGLTDDGDLVVYNYKTGNIINTYNILMPIQYLISLDIRPLTKKISIYVGSEQSKFMKIDWDRSNNLMINREEFPLQSPIINKVMTKSSKIICSSNDGFIYINK
ncbi:hypothetical protein CLIB1444_06S01178 [[Candida] jaroonii]|uniref:Uncharacterized protein n=1 Tax=[Candida] jaroonii TaxID=467808 RepID=A0ACA9Y8N0_9ASCO|nr:hypothetical protein CLIB1444_06S01178 [[Candida] jaroonii]